jgi:hypothetical protein
MTFILSSAIIPGPAKDEDEEREVMKYDDVF